MMQIFTTGLEYFTKGGFVMYPLLVCSIYAVAIGIERYFFFKKADSGKVFTKEFCQYIEKDNWLEAKKLADNTKGEIAKLATIVMDRHGNYEYLENFIGARAERAIDKFENKLSALSVIITLAPVLGLLGTITGMISSFNGLNQRAENPLAVTAGIGEALITTVFGLCISIVAVCLHAYFMKRLKGISLNVEEMSNTLLEAVGKNLEANCCRRVKQHG